MLKEMLHQVRERVAGPDTHACAREEDVRDLQRAVGDLRAEVRALRTALEAHQHTAPVPAAAEKPAKSATAPGKVAKARGRRAAAPEAVAAPAPGRIEVRQEDCIGCGTCVDVAPSAFVLRSDGKAYVVSQDGPADLVEEAIQACPTCCIVRVP